MPYKYIVKDLIHKHPTSLSHQTELPRLLRYHLLENLSHESNNESNVSGPQETLALYFYSKP